MPEDYVPVFLQVLAGILFAASTLAISVLIGKRGRRTHAKDQPYECGKDPIGPTHSRFSVKFYLVAMLFILFDIEVVFMYPWAVVYRETLTMNQVGHPQSFLDFVESVSHGWIFMGKGIFYSMFSFVGILLVGYLYALKKKAFDWTHNPGPKQED